MNKKRKNKIYDKIVDGLELSTKHKVRIRELLLLCIKTKSYTDDNIVSMLRLVATNHANPRTPTWVPIDESQYGLLCGKG